MSKNVGPVPVTVYRVAGAECVPVPYDMSSDAARDASLLAAGCNPWRGSDVVMMPDGSRAVFYPKGHPNAWPLNHAAPASPQAFTETDLRKMFGAYMVWLAEQALRPPEPEPGLSLGEIIIIVLACIDSVLAGGALYYGYKVLHLLGRSHLG